VRAKRGALGARRYIRGHLDGLIASKDTPNAADGIANANPAPLAMVTGDEASGFVATIAVTVA